MAKDIGKIIKDMNEFTLRRFVERVSSEFMNPDLPPEKKVPDAFQLEREMEYFRDKTPDQYKDVLGTTLRQALKDYVPAHIEFTANPNDELVLLDIQDKASNITRITGNAVTANQILRAATGVIDQTMENVLHSMPLAKMGGAGQSGGSGFPGH